MKNMKSFIGTITSTKMKKTVVVMVERSFKHPLYKKIVKRTKKYLAHDLIGVHEGDLVRIQETRPFSKRKRFKILEQIKKQTDNKSKSIKKVSKNIK